MMREAVAFLKAHDDLLLIAHISPDGDTLGSSLALYCGLKRLGKTVRVVCENPVPASYRFCPYADRVLLPEQAEPAKTVVAVDCADLLRTGACARFFETAEASLCIDHHETNRGFADVNWVSCVAATGELIYQLLVELEVPIDVEIATLLYTALAADTGNFAYSNTTADTFRIAAELRETGFDLPEINRLLFRTFPFAKLKLRARCIENCTLYADGRIAAAHITQADLADCSAAAADAEGLIDDLRDIETVEIAAVLREGIDGAIRVSLRGKRIADVSSIAVFFGGGGHRLAAGCTMYEDIHSAQQKIVDRAMIALTEVAD